MTATADLERPGFEMPDEALYSVADLGQGLTLRNRRTVELTTDYAVNFLEYPEFWVGDVKVDRVLSEPHVVHLCREMLSGNFRWEQVNLVLCKVDGQTYRLNGQHSAWGRIYADEQGLPKNTRTPVQILTYDAASIQDARRLYASLDRGKPRGTGTVVKSHLLGTEEFPGYRAGLLQLLAQGMGLWLWEKETQRTLHGGDDRAYLLLKDHHKLALVVGTIVKESKAADWKHMKRAPVVGAMFETCSKAPAIAQDFWRVVRDGTGITDKEDPRLVLRNYLMSASLAKSLLMNGDHKTVSQEAMYRSCVVQWNAFRRNRKTKTVRIDPEADRPAAV